MGGLGIEKSLFGIVLHPQTPFLSPCFSFPWEFVRVSAEKRAWNAQFSRRECCILIAHLSLLPGVDGAVRSDAFFLFFKTT